MPYGLQPDFFTSLELLSDKQLARFAAFHICNYHFEEAAERGYNAKAALFHQSHTNLAHKEALKRKLLTNTEPFDQWVEQMLKDPS